MYSKTKSPDFPCYYFHYRQIFGEWLIYLAGRTPAQQLSRLNPISKPVTGR
jgi:hypothetical protein